MKSTSDGYTLLQQGKGLTLNASLGLPGNGGIAQVTHELITQETGAKVNYIPGRWWSTCRPGREPADRAPMYALAIKTAGISLR